MKNTLTKIKNTLHRFNSRVNEAGDQRAVWKIRKLKAAYRIAKRKNNPKQ